MKSTSGNIDHKLPMLTIVVPNWLLKKHPDIGLTLEANQDVLISPFDLYQTLRQFPIYPLDMPQRESHKERRGLSLISNYLPKTRSCIDARIPIQFCVCMNWVELNQQQINAANNGDIMYGSIRNGVFKALLKMNEHLGYNSRIVTSSLSDLIDENFTPSEHSPNHKYCILLQFDKIVFASKITFSETFLTVTKAAHQFYRVQFQTKMEDGAQHPQQQEDDGKEEPRIFEILFMHPSGNNLIAYINLLEIKQITKYGNKPICSRTEDVKDICVCKASQATARN